MTALAIFRALADPTRLRIVALLRHMELSVGELAQVLGQSQPRVSRHVKILGDAGLAERRREGSWVFLGLGPVARSGVLLQAIDGWDDPVAAQWTVADSARLVAVRAGRIAAAEAYFDAHAGEWDAIRSLHVAEAEVEDAMLSALDGRPIGRLIDIGTGTGRMIELLASQAEGAIGIDRSAEMLRLARAKLAGAGPIEFRQGDIHALPLTDGAADTVVVHQVLHYAQAPGAAIAEAARVLALEGRLLIVDFAPHEREELREREGHARLGFDDAQVAGWLAASGLEPVSTRALAGGRTDCQTVAGAAGCGDTHPEGRGMSAPSFSQLEEARRALDAPLFADLAGDFAVSFEFFPPKSEKMEETLWQSIETLAPLGPRFVSVTYGAGGSTRERTHATVARIVRETDIPAAAHLTCVDATRDEIDAIARDYWAAGVRHIVALRGDPPRSGEKYAGHPGGYANAAELVAGLKRIAPFEISVAAYPECHPDSAHAQADIDNLKAKIDAGANRAITQFFFSPEHFFRFRDAAAAAGIKAEIVPGIMPVSTFAATKRMADMCGTEVPMWMERLFDGLEDHAGARQLVAATLAAELCRKLYAGGVREFHFYTLNRAELAYAICHLLGMRAKPVEKRAAA